MATEEMTATRWRLDPAATVAEFRVRHFWGLVPPVRGRFARVAAGRLELHPGGGGRAELRIDASSLDTGNGRRDRHLRSSDYFGCERHPEVRFRSTGVEPAEDGRLRITGELEAGGHCVPLELEAVTRRWGERLEIEADTTLDARRLGMSWSLVGSLHTPATLHLRASLQPED